MLTMPGSAEQIPDLHAHIDPDTHEHAQNLSGAWIFWDWRIIVKYPTCDKNKQEKLFPVSIQQLSRKKKLKNMD